MVRTRRSRNRQRRNWWRWYVSRFDARAIVMTVLGVLLFLVYALYSLSAHSAWYGDIAPPIAPLGLKYSSTAKVKPDVSVLLSGSYDTHNEVVETITGSLLVDERLVLYPNERTAKVQVLNAINASNNNVKRDHEGTFRALVGCPSDCRHARLIRIGTVVVLLVNRYDSGKPRAREANTALAELADRYAKSSGLQRLIEPDGSLDQALALVAVLCLLLLPFVIWQAWCVWRGQRTPYRAGEFGTLAGVTDVCLTARSMRRKGYLFLAIRITLYIAVSAIGGLVAVGVLSEGYALISIAVAPIAWLVIQPFTRKRRRRRIANPRPRHLRRLIASLSGVLGLLGVLVLEIVAAAFIFIAWVWGFTWVAVVAPNAVQSLLFDPTLSPVASTETALRIAAILAVFYGGFASITAINRLGRRVRWTAATVRTRTLANPVVLYLRDFTDDTRLVAAGDVISHPANEIFSFRGRVPYEEVIGRELGRNGSVLAIAEPASPRIFLPLGASRKWISDRQWHDAVLHQMSHAVLVIIAVGATEGLLWEITTATKKGLLDKIILLMPPDKDDALRMRWAATVNAIRAAGGPALDLTVDPACLLAIQVSATGPRQVIVSDRRDEYSYSAALEIALTSPATATITAAWITAQMTKEAPWESPPRSDQPRMHQSHRVLAGVGRSSAVARNAIRVSLRLLWASMDQLPPVRHITKQWLAALLAFFLNGVGIDRLPPVRRRTKPWLAALLAFFLNGVGIALYFRRRADVLVGIALGWPLFLLPGFGQSEQSSGPTTERMFPWWAWLWLGICALYAYLRALSSNEWLNAADAGRYPSTRAETGDIKGSGDGTEP